MYLQRARDRFGELHVGVEFRDQLADERHVDRPRDHMDPVRPHVGCQLDLADHHRVLGQRGQRRPTSGFHRGLRDDSVGAPARTPGCPDWPGSGLAGLALFENVLEHVDHLARVGPLQLDELADHFGRRNVHLVDDFARACE